MQNDFAAVTCFFSYVKNAHAVQRYKEFKDNLERQGVRLYTIELAFFDEDFLLKDDVYLRLRTDTVLWHKESLLNALVKRLPPRIKKIAWLDCDIEIEDDNWSEKARDLLEKYNVIEMGREHIYLDKEGDVEREHMTSGYAIHHKISEWKDFSKYHPGLGWASRRELFTQCGGLFKYGLSGGGDGIMAYIFGKSRWLSMRKMEMSNWMPDWKYNIFKDGCPSMIEKVKEYRDKVIPYVDGKVSYLDTKVIHRYHAPAGRRNYMTRPHVLNGIDLCNDLSEGSNGLFEWKDMRYNKVFETFFNMKDDQNRGSVRYTKVNVKNILK